MSEMITLPNATITPVSLTIPEGINYDEWHEIGKKLGEVNQGLLWWTGDWLNYGERSYGEKYAQAMDVTGYSYSTTKQAAYLARKFPPQVRRDTLTFSHYQTVAGLPDDICDRLLDLAEDNSLTVRELKEQRAEMEGVTPVTSKTTSVTCPECGATFNLDK